MNPKEIYTVQIGAFEIMSDVKFDLPKVFSHSYDDGYKRYFSGIFNTKAEASEHRKILIQKGMKGVFVVGLKGTERF